MNYQERYQLQHIKAIIKKDDKRANHKGLAPKFWNDATKDYNGNPTLPWICNKCSERFRYKEEVKKHLFEVHAY